MPILKLFHVLCVFLWLGNLLTLCSLLSFFAKATSATQLHLAYICKKIYQFALIPTLILTIGSGLLLLTKAQFGSSHGWFHMKLTFTVLLVICSLYLGKFLSKLAQGKPVSIFKCKILHIAALFSFIGALCAIYIARNKEAEIRVRVKQEIQTQKTQDSFEKVY